MFDKILDLFPPIIGILTGFLFAFITSPILVIRKIFNFPVYTNKIKHHKNSISELRNIIINDATHSILIRGNDSSNPVILILHGGPGFTDMIDHSKYSSFLEENFVVVHYDQRGSCKSGAINFNRKDLKEFEKTLTIEQHINDAISITEWLINNPELKCSDGIYLIGGSWGSMLGLYVVNRRPDLFKKVLFRGQCSNGPVSERLGMEFIKKRLQIFQFSEDKINEIISRGCPYGNDVERLIEQREWLNAVGGTVYDISLRKFNDGIICRWKLTHGVSYGLFLASEISLYEIIQMKSCMTKTLYHMWEEVETTNLIEIINNIKIPITLCHGIADHCTSYSLVNEFLSKLNAPEKYLVSFEKSGMY
jgi:pimeloyl-ACP methyl ester carboxylesterase